MKTIILKIAVPKPRNPFVILARKRKAGQFLAQRKRLQSERNKDLLQRLREAGL